MLAGGTELSCNLVGVTARRNIGESRRLGDQSPVAFSKPALSFQIAGGTGIILVS